MSDFRREHRPRGHIWSHGGRRARHNLSRMLLVHERTFIAQITGIPERLLEPNAPLEPVRDSALLRMLPKHEGFDEPPEGA